MEDDYSQKLIEYMFATQVLILANQLRTRKRAAGEEVKGDMIPEAIQLIKKKSEFIFENLDILE